MRQAGVKVEQARVFWAVNFPGEIKRKLFDFQSRLREVPADVKWVEQQNLHLTVKFLGSLDRGDIDKILQAVEGAAAGTGAFTLELEGAGFFPGPRKPRVVWVGVKGEVEKFRNLHHCVDASLAAVGFDPENRLFSPHLTLGRVRSLRGSEELVCRAQEAAREFGSLGTVEVNTIELMESRLTREGPVYTVLAGISLINEAGGGATGVCVPGCR